MARLSLIGTVACFLLVTLLHGDEKPSAKDDKSSKANSDSDLVRLEQVGHITAGVNDPFLSLAIQGKTAYLVQGNSETPKRLQVVDLSEPTKPRILGSCPLTAYAMRLAVSGSHVYVLDEPNFRAFDVSKPAMPREIGACKLEGNLWDLAIQGKYAYVTDVESVRVIDLTDPSKPRQVGQCKVAEAQGIALAGGYAYIACDTEGLSIFDISKPDKPEQVGRFTGPQGASAVVISGKYAYIAGGEDAVTLWIADISDPKAPKSAGKYGDWIAGNVAVEGNRAYIAGGELDILDVTNPAAPRSVGRHKDAGTVIIKGDTAYILGDEGFSIFRIVNKVKK
jgi:hypothetical protein